MMFFHSKTHKAVLDHDTVHSDICGYHYSLTAEMNPAILVYSLDTPGPENIPSL